MIHLRKYGSPPFRISVVHGGPGGPGQVAPLAKELSVEFGVLEPLQSIDSFYGQIQELKETIEENGEIPHILIGHSYGAILSLLLDVEYPKLIKKLILVSCALIDDKYEKNIDEQRRKRLKKEEREELSLLMRQIADQKEENKTRPMNIKRIEELLIKSD